jgi:hypothetical protein
MSNNQSLGVRLKEGLSSNLSVSVVSVVLAVVALFVFAQIGDPTPGGILLALNIGVFIPYAYERYWPVAYSSSAAVVWATSAALITTGVFIGTHQIALRVSPDEYIEGIAFVLTVLIQYGIAALFMRVRQNA